MKRMKVLFGNRRMMVLLTLAILVLVAAALVASSASFTATSANPNNTFTTGSLTIGNYLSNGTTSNEGQAIAGLSMANMKPTSTKSGTAVIKNDGSIAGDFTLSLSKVDSLGKPAFPLSGILTLKITETVLPSGTPQVIYDSVLGTMTPRNLHTFAAGESRQYDFVVTFPTGVAANDNDYQGAKSVVEFAWTAVQN